MDSAIVPSTAQLTPLEDKVLQEQETEITEDERMLALVLEDPRWNKVELYIKEVIANYNDIRSLLSIPDKEEFHVQARAKAVIVDEMEKFLSFVYETAEGVKQGLADERSSRGE